MKRIPVILTIFFLVLLGMLPAKSQDENHVLQLKPVMSLSHQLVFDSMSSGNGAMEARWSKDNRKILSWHWNGGIHVWNVISGESLFEIPPDGNPMQLVGWSPDERYVLTIYTAANNQPNECGSNGKCGSSVQVWDTQTGEMLRELTHSRRLSSASLSPNGRLVFTIAGDDYYRIWDIETGQELLTFPCQGYCYSGNWSADGNILATSETGVVKLWDTSTGDVLGSIPTPGMICRILWNSDSTSFFIQCSQIPCDSNCQYRLSLFSTHGQTEIWHRSTTDYGTAGVWLDGRKPIAYWQVGGVLYLWDVAQDVSLLTLDHQDNFERAPLWNNEGKQLLTYRGIFNGNLCCKGNSRVWDVSNGNLISVIDETILQAAWHPNRNVIATDNWAGISIWDTETGLKLAEDATPYEAYDQLYRPGDQGMAWNVDGTRLLAWSGMGVISIYDMNGLQS